MSSSSTIQSGSSTDQRLIPVLKKLYIAGQQCGCDPDTIVELTQQCVDGRMTWEEAHKKMKRDISEKMKRDISEAKKKEGAVGSSSGDQKKEHEDKEKSNDVSEPLKRDNLGRPDPDADEHCNDQRHTEYWSVDHTWIPAEKFDIIQYTNPNPVQGWWCPDEELSYETRAVLKLNLDSDKTRAFFIAREEKKKARRLFRLYKENGGFVIPKLDADECEENFENRDDEDPDCEFYSNHPLCEWPYGAACGEGKFIQIHSNLNEFIRVSIKKRKLNSDVLLHEGNKKKRKISVCDADDDDDDY